jgi:DNA-binding transcriptional regulator GbsR (MarR family)
MTAAPETGWREEPILRLEEQFGSFFEHFGFRRNLGRVWLTLYLSEVPLDQGELGARLGLSVGLISAGLRELEQVGAVRVVSRPSARKSYYEAERNLLRTVATILVRRDLEAVRALGELVQETRAKLPDSLTPYARESLEERLDRVSDLTELYELMARLVIRVARNPEVGLSRLLRFLRTSRSWLGVSRD